MFPPMPATSNQRVAIPRSEENAYTPDAAGPTRSSCATLVAPVPRGARQNPANRHKAVGLTFEQWNYTFTNGFPEDEARRLYERYHVPASGEVFWGSALANIHPGKDETWVNYDNDGRAPLLFISGSADHLMPPSIQRSNAKHWNDNVITEVKEFEGPHLLPAWPGWEQVADYALDWALEHAAVPSTR
jgi:pimeloyl-ACP methyl ester carboxylesterase